MDLLLQRVINGEELNLYTTFEKVDEKEYDNVFNKLLKYQDNKYIQNCIGLIYYSSLLGKKYNITDTNKWFLLSAQQGYAEAQKNLGLYYYSIDDYTNAITWFHKAAEQGHALSQLKLGNIYLYDKKDHKESFIWFFKAANQEIMSAQYTIGSMYENGDGIEIDMKEALKWYLKSANSGCTASIRKVETIYYNNKNFIEYFKWDRKINDIGNNFLYNKETIDALHEIVVDEWKTTRKLWYKAIKDEIKEYICDDNLTIVIDYILRD